MELRMAQEKDYKQLAEMKWLHCEEDDADYNTTDTVGIDKNEFIGDFISFLNKHKEYKIFVAADNDSVVSSMFVYLLPKTPKPKRKQDYIAYLTNVYTLKDYRNKGIGTELIAYIKEYLSNENCELIFVWPSEKSVDWYSRNGFRQENEIFECSLEN